MGCSPSLAINRFSAGSRCRRQGRSIAKDVKSPVGLVVIRSVEFIRGFPDFQNSMHADFENGRPTELDALNGASAFRSRMGKDIKPVTIPTPINGIHLRGLAPLKQFGTPVVIVPNTSGPNI